jgi:hypothetical protein
VVARCSPGRGNPNIRSLNLFSISFAGVDPLLFRLFGRERRLSPFSGQQGGLMALFAHISHVCITEYIVIRWERSDATQTEQQPLFFGGVRCWCT